MLMLCKEGIFFELLSVGFDTCSALYKLKQALPAWIPLANKNH